ncbi:hypothetical protein [Microbispora sp. H13382]|uniref:hypothetical protein n=1 Tax=Microbispora sp. H13382 TaxID=2729112 RepID=UPI001602F056|nr:hypothetical protein [Microbispora sp. H13382]
MPIEPSLDHMLICDLGFLPAPGAPWVIIVVLVLVPQLVKKLRKAVTTLISRVAVNGCLTLSVRVG